MEIRKLDDFDNYFVSPSGQVFRRVIGHLDRYGYERFRLSNKKNTKSYSAHRLVALAYIPNQENKPEVNHKNGVKTDNHKYNLEWATRSENAKHAFEMGLIDPRKANRV